MFSALLAAAFAAGSGCAGEPEAATHNKDAATGTFTVSAPASCNWSAVSSGSWLTVSGGAPGSGPGTVSYAVAKNLDTADRSGSITVAGRTFTVRQSGDAGACSYSVAPVAFQPCMPAGTLNATITTQASCPWTAASNSSWLAVASGASGNGSAVIDLRDVIERLLDTRFGIHRAPLQRVLPPRVRREGAG